MIDRSLVERWLREDVGHHDVTNDVDGRTTGRLVAKEPGVAAGLDAAGAVFDYLGCPVEERVEPGDQVAAGDTLLTVEGPAREVLRSERPAANVVMHASGVATRTRRAVDRVEAVREGVAVAGTRKTTPGLRGVEKRAVAAGGGDTHRLDLSHAVMVKDNHAGELGLETAVARFAERASFTTPVEAEVERPADAPRAAAAGADAVLLDNMSPAETREAVERLPEGTLVEASGDIGIEDATEYARAGVDVVSMGGLTYGATWLDCSFRTGDPA